MANAKAAIAPPEAKRKGKAGLIILLFFILIVAAGITMTALNVFGIRDNVLFPALRNVPFLGSFIPDAPATELEPDLALTITALEERIANMLSEIASLEEDLGILLDIVERSELEIARLRMFEEAQEDFIRMMDEFYRDLADENPDAFLNAFEHMHPARAAEIYENILGGLVADAEWQNYLATWSATTAVNVAASIETMLTTDMPLIVRVLPHLDAGFRGQILNNLSEESRALILRQLDRALTQP